MLPGQLALRPQPLVALSIEAHGLSGRSNSRFFSRLSFRERARLTSEPARAHHGESDDARRNSRWRELAIARSSRIGIARQRARKGVSRPATALFAYEGRFVYPARSSCGRQWSPRRPRERSAAPVSARDAKDQAERRCCRAAAKKPSTASNSGADTIAAVIAALHYCSADTFLTFAIKIPGNLGFCMAERRTLGREDFQVVKTGIPFNQHSALRNKQHVDMKRASRFAGSRSPPSKGQCLGQKL